MEKNLTRIIHSVLKNKQTHSSCSKDEFQILSKLNVKLFFIVLVKLIFGCIMFTSTSDTIDYDRDVLAICCQITFNPLCIIIRKIWVELLADVTDFWKVNTKLNLFATVQYIYVTGFGKRCLFHTQNLTHFWTSQLHNFFIIAYNNLKFSMSETTVPGCILMQRAAYTIRIRSQLFV